MVSMLIPIDFVTWRAVGSWGLFCCLHHCRAGQGVAPDALCLRKAPGGRSLLSHLQGPSRRGHRAQCSNSVLLSVSLPSSFFLDLTSLRACSVAQSCPALCNPIDYSPPGSSVHGIFQASILEWVAISFSKGPSQSRD